MPNSPGVPGRVRRWGVLAELPQLALGSVAVPGRAKGVECRRGELELVRSAVALARLGERASGELRAWAASHTAATDSNASAAESARDRPRSSSSRIRASELSTLPDARVRSWPTYRARVGERAVVVDAPLRRQGGAELPGD